jgi:hypothetical protein
VKAPNLYLLALYASLPALAFGGCTCSNPSSPPPPMRQPQGCAPITCDLSEHCATALDCAAPFDPCSVAACEGQRCVTVPGPDGIAPPSAQTTGDCAIAFCSGGEMVDMPASDPPSIADACQVGACDGTTPVFANASDGTDCTMGAEPAACVSGHCLRLPSDIAGTGGGGTGGGGTGGGGTGGGGTGGGGTGGATMDGGTDGGTDGGSTDGGSTDGGEVDGGGPTCLHCFEVLYGGAPAALCASSQPVYAALATCICGPTCGAACDADICQHEPPTAECDDCIASVQTGCGSQLTACNQDF